MYSMFFRIHVFQSPGFSWSKFFRVQVIQGPGFSRCRTRSSFFRDWVQGLGSCFRNIYLSGTLFTGAHLARGGGFQGVQTPARFWYSPNCALKFVNQLRRNALKISWKTKQSIKTMNQKHSLEVFQHYFKKDTKTWFSVRLIYSHSLLHNVNYNL